MVVALELWVLPWWGWQQAYKPSISSAGPGFPFSILWKSLCPITLGAGNDSDCGQLLHQFL